MDTEELAAKGLKDTGSENYRVGYATATSPYGPFTAKGLILSKDSALGILGTGHSSIIQVPGTDDWYIAYHRFAMPGGSGIGWPRASSPWRAKSNRTIRWTRSMPT